MSDSPPPAFDLSTRQYFRLLEGLQQAVIGTDREGKVILWSSAAEALYGWSAAEVIGLNILEVLPATISKALGGEIMKLLTEGQVWSGSFAVRSKTNHSFQVSVTDVPLMDADRKVSGIIGVSGLPDPVTSIAAIVSDLNAACDLVWPGKVVVEASEDSPKLITANKPHVTQLLALALSRFAEALEGGAYVDVRFSSPKRSPFEDFHLRGLSKADVYITISERRERQTLGILRGIFRSPQRTEYAATLVNMVAGDMILASTGVGPADVHILLPGAAT